MKQKISVTIDSELIELVGKELDDGRFRNRSHVVEYSLKKFLGEKQNEN